MGPPVTRRYNPKDSEPRWRKAWSDADAFKAVIDHSKPKYYVLEMFPYPSGRLHMGHVRNYALGDVIARFKRARGFSVLHPMGWDAFGLPAENAAMERGVDPKAWTYDNIARMRDELKQLGLSIDWSREFATCDVGYYGKQQAWFLDLLAAGLVYRKESLVNWDPVDQTVLANEQVVDGRGWRSGAVVEKRKLNQWAMRITDYADQLTDDLKTLDRWPEKVRVMQENWIGRSRGLKFRFHFAGESPVAAPDGLEVYTTRPDTLYGASFVGIAADHPLAAAVAARDPKAAAYIEQCRKGAATQAEIDTAEKTGYDTGLRVKHPFDPDWELPVWIANFILMDYGTGAIFCKQYAVIKPPGPPPTIPTFNRSMRSSQATALPFRERKHWRCVAVGLQSLLNGFPPTTATAETNGSFCSHQSQTIAPAGSVAPSVVSDPGTNGTRRGATASSRGCGG